MHVCHCRHSGQIHEGAACGQDRVEAWQGDDVDDSYTKRIRKICNDNINLAAGKEIIMEARWVGWVCPNQYWLGVEGAASLPQLAG